MNSLNRVRAALLSQRTDRAPVVPEIIQHALTVSGATHRAYSTRGEVMAQTVIAAQEKYQYDAVYVSSDNFIYAEAFGGEVSLPEDDTPQLVSHPLREGLGAPLPEFDLEKGRMQVILKATALCRKHYGDYVLVKTNIDSAPFSAAASLRGPQDFLTDLFDEEEAAHALLKTCTDAVIRYGLAAAEAGAHAIAFGDSVAGLLGREMYRTFALPYARQAISSLRRETGLPVFYHVCGNTNHLLPLLVATGADCLELDSDVDMADARPLAQGRCALEGNIDTIRTLYYGTPADVRREANRLLSLFGNRGGFILSSACEIPRFSPPENVMEITRAAMEFDYSIGP